VILTKYELLPHGLATLKIHYNETLNANFSFIFKDDDELRPTIKPFSKTNRFVRSNAVSQLLLGFLIIQPLKKGSSIYIFAKLEMSSQWEGAYRF
jgi:hypothetical protein